MRRYTIFAILLVAAMVLGACAKPAATPAPSEPGAASAGGNVTINMAGSTTVQPLAEKLANAYMAAHSNVKIVVTGGGSGVGVKSAADGTAQIGMASREVKDEERTANPNLKDIAIARDGIALIANKDVTVSDLTKEQAQQIFSGTITNWSEVGGEDQAIILVSREEGSGTRAAFQEMVMGTDKDGNDNLIAETAILQSSNGAILTTVSGTPHSLGYLSMGYVDDTVKVMMMNGVAATEENAANGSYPVVRPLNLLTNGDATGEVKAFLDWILSAEGQKIVSEDGYITVK